MERFNIYHRKDGRWEGRLSKGKDADGKRRYRSFFGHSHEEVQKKMAEYLQNQTTENMPLLKVSDLFQEWMMSIRHRVKESTAANYLMKGKRHILPYFGDMSVYEVVPTTVCQFIIQKQQEKLSDRYVSDIVILMKSLFKYAVRMYHIINPLEHITLPKKHLPEIRMLDSGEQAKLQQYIAEHRNLTTLGIALAMSTGIRIGELCALQWTDIDLEKRILTVRKTLQRIQSPTSVTKTKLIITNPKSESSRRTIPIPECMADFLKRFQAEDAVYLLSGKETPMEPRTMQYRFAAVLRNAKLPSVRFHSLRHLFASGCIKLGFDIKALSEILGHSSVEITLNRYIHSSLEQKREYMNRVKFLL